MISVTIDGKEIKTEEKRTILEVARENGVYIPTLCYHERLFPIGSCRLCIVEIEGFDRPQTSCNTYVTEGMKIKTNTERLYLMRREFLKFILMEHPLDCPQCDKAGECKLQDLVYEHGIEKGEYKIDGKKERLEPFSTPLIRKWAKRCVLCLRCYHACLESAGRGVLGIKGGGYEAKIEVVRGEECISCGECLSVCPVGALTENLSPKKTRPWMAEETVTTCSHCGFGCSLVLVSQDGYLAKVKGEERLLPNSGSLCVRGRFGYDFANSDSRIERCVRRIYDEKREISLEEAESELISRLKAIDSEGGGVGFLLSPRLTNEEAYLIAELGKILKKAYFSSSAYFFPYKLINLYKSAGIPYGYDYGDINACDLIFVTGSDLLTDNHLLGVKIREAVKKRGTKVVTVDQYDSSLSNIAHINFRVRPGLERIVFDVIALEFIREGDKALNVSNYEEFRSRLLATEREERQKELGLKDEDLKELISLVRRSEKIGIVIGSGTKDSTLASILNLSLVSGSLLFPAIEQSNGIGISAILKNVLSPKDLFKDSNIKGILVFEEEPAHYVPDSLLSEAYKSKYIVNFTFLPTYVTNYAHLVFPFSGFHEKEGTYVSGSGRIGYVKRMKMARIDSLSFLKDLLLKLGGSIPEGDVTKEINQYLKEEKKEKAFIVESRTEVNGDDGEYFLVAKDIFKSPYLKYSKGMSLIDSSPIYISMEDANSLNIRQKDKVRIWNGRGSETGEVSIEKSLVKGVILYKPAFDFRFVKLFDEIDKPAKVKLEKA